MMIILFTQHKKVPLALFVTSLASIDDGDIFIRRGNLDQGRCSNRLDGSKQVRMNCVTLLGPHLL